MSTLASRLNRFGHDLYRHLPANGNLVVSPFSIALALTALLLGARRDTAQRLADALHIKREKLEAQCEQLRDLLSKNARVEGPSYVYDKATGDSVETTHTFYQLHIAHALFLTQTLQWESSYQHQMDRLFAAQIESVDFSQAKQASDHINAWAREHTQGLIDQIVQPTMFNESSRLVLANAVYFKAAWDNPFIEPWTQPGTFHCLDGKERSANFMHDSGYYHYTHRVDLAADILALPCYQADMLIVLPHAGGLARLEGRLDDIDAVYQGLESRLVDLALPRFSCESELELIDVLDVLGLQCLREEGADFRGITADADGLVLSSVLHKARVGIDEEGVEAAAVTVMPMECGSAVQARPTPIPFIVDRPFVFVIRERSSGAVLFRGRIVSCGQE